jgi:hypothetical protein
MPTSSPRTPTTGRRRTPRFRMRSSTCQTSSFSSAVSSGSLITSPALTPSGETFLATRASTMSRSVMMPTGYTKPFASRVTTTLPTWCWRINSATVRSESAGLAMTTPRLQISAMGMAAAP